MQRKLSRILEDLHCDYGSLLRKYESSVGKRAEAVENWKAAHKENQIMSQERNQLLHEMEELNKQLYSVTKERDLLLAAAAEAASRN